MIGAEGLAAAAEYGAPDSSPLAAEATARILSALTRYFLKKMRKKMNIL